MQTDKPSTRDISILAGKLSVQTCKRLSLEYLGLSHLDIDNLEYDYRGSSYEFNNGCLSLWLRRAGAKASLAWLNQCISQMGSDTQAIYPLDKPLALGKEDLNRTWYRNEPTAPEENVSANIPTDKDLSEIASQLSKEMCTRLCLEHLNLTSTDLDQIAYDASNSSYNFNFTCLQNWKQRNGNNASLPWLLHCIDSLMQRSKREGSYQYGLPEKQLRRYSPKPTKDPNDDCAAASGHQLWYPKEQHEQTEESNKSDTLDESSDSGNLSGSESAENLVRANEFQPNLSPLKLTSSDDSTCKEASGNLPSDKFNMMDVETSTNNAIPTFTNESNQIAKFIECLKTKYLKLELAPKTPSMSNEKAPMLSTELRLETFKESQWPNLNTDTTVLINYSDLFTMKLTEKVDQRFIVIEGIAGSGKTILARQMSAEWAMGKTRLAQLYDVVFHLELKYFDVSRNLVPELLRILKTDTRNDFNRECIETMLSTTKCLFLFDGLDEILLQRNLNVNKAESTVADVLLGRSHINATVCITTRPHGKLPMENDAKLIKVICKGFNGSGVHNFMTFYLDNSKNQAEEVIALCPNEFQELSNLPLTLRTICDLQKSGHSIPTIMANFYYMVVEFMLIKRSNSRKVNVDADLLSRCYQKLSRLCWHILFETKPTFQIHELEEAMGSSNEFHTLLNTGLIYSDTDDTYCFIHRSVQERCAASYVLQEMQSERGWHHRHIPDLHNILAMDKILRFLFGLISDSTVSLAVVLIDYMVELYVVYSKNLARIEGISAADEFLRVQALQRHCIQQARDLLAIGPVYLFNFNNKGDKLNPEVELLFTAASSSSIPNSRFYDFDDCSSEPSSHPPLWLNDQHKVTVRGLTGLLPSKQMNLTELLAQGSNCCTLI